MNNVFDIVKNINKKESILDDETLESFYDGFIISRAFSNTYDTVFFANEMNFLNVIDKKMQYHFYYYGIDKNPRRFGKWHKMEKMSEKLKLIKEYYGYSNQKAKDVLHLIDEKQLKHIKQSLEKGGVKNGK